ncbi:MAG: hypothetical protein B7Y01_02165, partial [Xanthobacter sp. 17-67-6]
AHLRLAVRATVAAAIAFLLAWLLDLPKGYWAVLTAILVVQSSIGASLAVAVDRCLGTLAGGGIGVVLAMIAGPSWSLSFALLLLGTFVSAFIAARNPSFKLAPVTVVIVMLADPTHAEPWISGLERVSEIALGGAVGLACALLVLPDKALGYLFPHVADALEASADLLEAGVAALLDGGLDPARMDVLNQKVRVTLRAADVRAGEARRERVGPFNAAPDPGPIVRGGRRLWHSVIILLRGAISLEEAQALSQAIIADFRHPLVYQDRSLSTKASIGLAACPNADYAPGELMKDADLALYAAKQEGRNRAVLYAPAMRRAMNERISLNRSLANAVAGNEITPYYQPKVSLITGQLMGFEALMRWKRSTTQVLQPQSFLTAFEDPELALLMGDTMLRQVARDVRKWLDLGYPVGRVAVNLSPAQFTHRDLANQILELLAAEGVTPNHFDVEITETVFLGRNSDFVAPILGQLHSAGMNLALDDFGTGYAALTHLKQLPIDTIKIDRSFVQDTESDSFDAAIVCTVIELGKNLGMCVVAEGVETVGQARFLRERGCEVAQGFLYARPMPAAATAEFLARETRDTAATRVCDLWGR